MGSFNDVLIYFCLGIHARSKNNQTTGNQLYLTTWLALLLGCSYPVGYFTENFLGSLDVNIRGKQLE